MPVDYQRDFAKSCYDALNGKKSFTLPQAMATNEIADNRCVGFTVETKPDYCKEPHIDLMLEFGVTRIEIGIQSLNNNVYKLVNRGYTIDDVVHAFKNRSGCRLQDSRSYDARIAREYRLKKTLKISGDCLKTMPSSLTC